MLDEESRNMTTFSTHKGLRRYKGCVSVQTVLLKFSNTKSVKQFKTFQMQKNMSDDVIVWGRTQQEHNTALESVLQRFREKGVTPNGPKCRYNKTFMV